MFLRKLFWNLGGVLPVWMIHPGQIILLVERKLGATLFKGATLPAWWTPRTAPTLVFVAGFSTAVVFGIVGALYTIQKFGDDFSVELLLTICAIGFGAGFALCGSDALSTIWPWRHLRVAVCTVGEKRAACKIAREPCVFEHVGGLPAQERFVHWFWGPTLGSQDWKFRFKTGAEAGDEMNDSFMVVSDRKGEMMSFTIHEMTDIDSIYSWRGQCLHEVHWNLSMHCWFDLLLVLFRSSSRKHNDAEEKSTRLSAELRLARIEKDAWSDLIGRLFACYLEDGRTTRPDREIALRLRRMEYDVVRPYMKYVAQRPHGLDSDPAKLGALFDAMDWPVLVSGRRKKRAG